MNGCCSYEEKEEEGGYEMEKEEEEEEEEEDLRLYTKPIINHERGRVREVRGGGRGEKASGHHNRLTIKKRGCRKRRTFLCSTTKHCPPPKMGFFPYVRNTHTHTHKEEEVMHIPFWVFFPLPPAPPSI